MGVVGATMPRLTIGFKMITTIAFAMALTQLSPFDQIQRQPPIWVGWQDELNRVEDWSPLAMLNQARAITPLPGILVLSLDRVPSDWPYTYQWSGVTRDAQVDIAQFPVLMARVLWVKGYAHMDIDVLDAHGKAVKTLRSGTVNGPGMSTIDLSTVLDPAYYSLRLRLIVGGDNSGCTATYDWVRFVKQSDVDRLNRNPDFPNVRLYGQVLR